MQLNGVRRGWSNRQFNLTKNFGTGPILNFALDEVPDVLQAMCDAICEVYQWRRIVLPPRLDVHQGTWRTASTPPPGWPHAANRYEVVSLAVTGYHQFCWTEPGGLAEALPRT